MVSVAACFVGGIAAGHLLPLPVGFWAALLIAACAVAATGLLRPHLHLLAVMAIVLAIVALGAVDIHMQLHSVPADHIVTYTAEHPSLATVRGRIVSAPQEVESSPDLLGYRRPAQTVFILGADAVKTNHGWANATGLVRVIIDQPAPRLRAGQRVTVAGWIHRFGPPSNPGQFDWSRAARRDGVWAWMSVPAPGAVEFITGGRLSWPARAIWRLRASARQHLLATGGRPEGDLLNALILGERSPALRKLNETMVRAGIAHFLSISGLHLGIFLGFVYLACRLVMLSPRRAAGIVLAVLTCYLLLAEPRAPLLRSAIMAAALCIATIARRRVAYLNSLAVAAVFILAIDPAQLLAPGFQLSFAIVAGLILFTEPVRRRLFAAFLRRRGLMVFRDDHRLRRWVYYSLANWLMTVVAMSLIAYFVAGPLVAYHFGIFTPYAPLLSVLLLPIVAAVLVVGHLSLALYWPVPNLAYSIGQVAAQIADVLANMISWLDRLPGLTFALRPMCWPWVLLCYAAMLVVLLKRRLPLRRLLASAMAVALVAVTVWTQCTAAPPDLAELNLLAVGSGQCAILRAPSGRTYLFDAGTRSGYDIADRTIEPFLRALRLPAPKVAFISHANTDHFNALPQLLRQGRLRRVYLNPFFGISNDHAGGAASAQLLEQLTDRNVEIVRVCEGDEIRLDDRTSVRALWPDALLPCGTAVNDRSLVLRITCDDRSILLTGDIKQYAITELLDRSCPLTADGLVLPHHGGWADALPAFVQAVSPGVVLRSSTRPQPIPDSDEERTEFFQSLHVGRLYCTTYDDGWIQLRFGRGRCELTTMRQPRQ